MLKPNISSWHSDQGAPTNIGDSWQGALRKCYGKRLQSDPVNEGFNAQLLTADMGCVILHDCICDPFEGRSSVSKYIENDEKFVIQLVNEGVEKVSQGDQCYELSAGDIYVWDNRKSAQFTVTERFHKTSLVLPATRLNDWMPRNGKKSIGKLPKQSPSAILLGALIGGMKSNGFYSSSFDDRALAEAVIATLVSGSLNDIESTSLQDTRMSSIKGYIYENLQDTNLSAKLIALHGGVSTRYLYWLFEQEGTTVSRFIVKERLALSRRDLLNPSMNTRSILDIAYSVGFTTPAHFSKRYRDHYGETPTQTRSHQYEA